jgi:hypothetical protein
MPFVCCQKVPRCAWPCFFLLLILSATARAAEPAGFIGLWGNETASGPRLSGVLVVDGRLTPWQASVAGMSATVEREGESVRFTMPGGQGQFRGRMTGGHIEGLWIQPPGQGLAISSLSIDPKSGLMRPNKLSIANDQARQSMVTSSK